KIRQKAHMSWLQSRRRLSWSTAARSCDEPDRAEISTQTLIAHTCHLQHRWEGVVRFCCLWGERVRGRSWSAVPSEAKGMQVPAVLADCSATKRGGVPIDNSIL